MTTAFRRLRPGRLALPVTVILVYVYILMPVVFVSWIAFFDQDLIVFPPEGYTLRWFVNAWERRAFSRGFSTSFQVAAVAMVFGVILGTLASIALVRYRFRGREALNTLLLSPLIVPGIVAGTVLVGILCMNAYATPVLLGGSQFKMMAPAVYDQMARATNWPMGAALSFVLMAATVSLTIVSTLVFKRRMAKD